MADYRKKNKLTIPGLPEFVLVYYYSDTVFAEIPCDEATKIKDFALALNMLSELGFEYMFTSHTLGYYDSVENLTMEFIRSKSKAFINKYKVNARQV